MHRTSWAGIAACCALLACTAGEGAPDGANLDASVPDGRARADAGITADAGSPVDASPDPDAAMESLDAARGDVGTAICAIRVPGPDTRGAQVGGNGGAAGEDLACLYDEAVVGLAMVMSDGPTEGGGRSALGVSIACAAVRSSTAGLVFGRETWIELAGDGGHGWSPGTRTPFARCPRGWLLTGIQASRGASGASLVDLSIVCSEVDGVLAPTLARQLVALAGSSSENAIYDLAECPVGQVIHHVATRVGHGIDALTPHCAPPVCGPDEPVRCSGDEGPRFVACDLVGQDCADPCRSRCVAVARSNDGIIPPPAETACSGLSGPRSEGQSCTRPTGAAGVDTCEPGLICTLFGVDDPSSGRVCRRYCRDTGECGAGQSCVLFEPSTVPSTGYCLPTCHPFVTECASIGANPQVCVSFDTTEGGHALACFPPGSNTRGRGSLCFRRDSFDRYPGDCEEGSSCEDTGTGATRCLPFCDATHPCDQGSCVAPVGAVGYRVCSL